MRRFSYVLEWAGIVVIVGTLIVRVPLLLAYFRNVPDVLDYLPLERFVMSGLIIAFCSVQISLVLHNESLGAAFRAHREFIQRNLFRFGWFLLIAALHFFFLTAMRCHCSRRDGGSCGGGDRMENNLRLCAGTDHRLAPGLVGLFVPPVRDCARESGNVDPVLR